MSDFNDIYSTAFDNIAQPIFGDTVSYKKNGEDAFDVTAMTSKVSVDQLLNFGASLTTTAREFIVEVADLAIDGVQFEPDRYDTITETINGAETVFEIMPIGDSAIWEYSDTDRKYYIIRGAEVSA